MKRFLGWSAVAAVMGSVFVGSVSANAADVDIYQGQALDTKGITLSAYANGEAAESTDLTFGGNKVLKITTRGKYQGGTLSFATPIDMSAALTDASNLLTFTVYIPSNSSNSSYRLRTPSSLRVVLTTDDDKKSELMIPYQGATASSGWATQGVPLSVFPKFSETSKRVKSITLSTDVPTSLYIGEIRVTQDTNPISAEAFLNEGVKDKYIANNDVVLCWATAEGGSSTLKYTWDFDKTDGIQEDQEGRVVEHTFRKPGEYIVTLTVSDRFGKKQPVTKELTVKVAP